MNDRVNEHYIMNPNMSMEKLKKSDNFDIKGSFGVSANDLQELQSHYEKRKFNEDLLQLEGFGGVKKIESLIKNKQS